MILCSQAEALAQARAQWLHDGDGDSLLLQGVENEVISETEVFSLIFLQSCEDDIQICAKPNPHSYR